MKLYQGLLLVVILGLPSGWALATSAYSTTPTAVVEAMDQADKKVQTLKTAGTADTSCNCTLPKVEDLTAYETPEQCGPERNYYQAELNAFAKVDPHGYYTTSRPSSQTTEGVFPKKCTTYIMKSFWKNKAQTAQEKWQAAIDNAKDPIDLDAAKKKTVADYHDDVNMFSTCGKPDDKGGMRTFNDSLGNTIVYKDIVYNPERSAYKPCVTEEYVNEVYNSLLDISDCMNLPLKFMAPKLSNESGLHPNAYAKGGDAGVGQFTASALRDVYVNFDNYKNRLNTSTKASCKRLLSIPGAFPKDKTEILPDDDQRCYMIASPPNPVRSMLMYGMFYDNTLRNATSTWNKTSSPDPAFKSVDTLMTEAGIASYNKDVIKQMLFVMAYNSGPAQPVTYYKDWLRYRIANLKKFPITKEDFDMNYYPADKTWFKLPKGDERAKAMDDGKPLTFAQYLFAYRDTLYVSEVKANATRIDKAVGEGVCTENKFLEL